MVPLERDGRAGDCEHDGVTDDILAMSVVMCVCLYLSCGSSTETWPDSRLKGSVADLRERSALDNLQCAIAELA